MAVAAYELVATLDGFRVALTNEHVHILRIPPSSSGMSLHTVLPRSVPLPLGIHVAGFGVWQLLSVRAQIIEDAYGEAPPPPDSGNADAATLRTISGRPSA